MEGASVYSGIVCAVKEGDHVKFINLIKSGDNSIWVHIETLDNKESKIRKRPFEDFEIIKAKLSKCPDRVKIEIRNESERGFIGWCRISDID
jgi:hypothetical protein